MTYQIFFALNKAKVQQTLDTFGVTEARTAAYHLAGDGLVEWLNCSLLLMLQAFVNQGNWEQYLPYVHFAYPTAVHSFTGVSPLN